MNPEELENLYKLAVEGNHEATKAILDYARSKYNKLTQSSYGLNNLRSKLFVFDYKSDKRTVKSNSGLLPILIPPLHSQSTAWLPFNVLWVLQMQTNRVLTAFSTGGLEYSPFTPSNILFFDFEKDDPTLFKKNLEIYLFSEQYIFAIENLDSLDLTEPLLKRKRPIIISTNHSLIKRAEEMGLSAIQLKENIPGMWSAIATAELLHKGTLQNIKSKGIKYSFCHKKKFLDRPVFNTDFYNNLLLSHLRGAILDFPKSKKQMLIDDSGILARRVVSEFFVDSLIEEYSSGLDLDKFYLKNISNEFAEKIAFFAKGEENYIALGRERDPPKRAKPELTHMWEQKLNGKKIFINGNHDPEDFGEKDSYELGIASVSLGAGREKIDTLSI